MPLVELECLPAHLCRHLFGDGRCPALAGCRDGHQGRPAPHRRLGQTRPAPAGERLVGSSEGRGIRAVRVPAVALVEPGAGDVHRPPRLTTVALIHGTPRPIGLVQPLHQRRRQGRRGEQHPRAEHAGPVDQARQRGEVVQVEVVHLVEHEVAAEQAQHGGDLAPTAEPVGGGHEVIHGAGEDRGGDQRAHTRVMGELAQQGMVAEIALEIDVGVLLHEALAGGRAAGIRLRLEVLEQRAARRPAGTHGELVVAEIHQRPIRPPGLKRERAQTKGDRESRTTVRVREGIQDPAVGQGLPAPRRRHVDAEEPLRLRAFTQGGREVVGAVLPAEARVGAAAAESAVAGQPRQVALDTGQRAADPARPGLHAEEVLVEGLVERPGAAHGIGVEGITPFAARALAGILQAGVVVVRQHQAQPGEVHDVGIVQPRLLIVIETANQPAGQVRGAVAPLLGSHRQRVIEPPIAGELAGIAPVHDIVVPVRGNERWQIPQLRGLETAVVGGSRHHRQAVMGDDEPAHGGRQRRQRGKRRGRAVVQAVPHQPFQPGPVIRIQLGQPGEPRGVVVTGDERLEQPQADPFVPVDVAGGAGGVEQASLERGARLAQVVQQGRQARQQEDVLAGVPVVLVRPPQDVPARGLRGHGAARVEPPGIADDPQQLAVIAPAYPVAGHGGVPARAAAKQAAQGVQTGLGDGRLPGALATAFRELVENPPRLLEGVLAALGDEQHVHRAGVPSVTATDFSVSIMKSSDSVRVSCSIQA